MAGLASAIRLAAKGHPVRVFEKNPYPGGKLSEFRLGAYRFDKGPSLFTLPELVNDLSRVAGKDVSDFKYKRLQTICRYFYQDGTKIIAKSDPLIFAKELKEKLGEKEEDVLKYLKKSEFYYQTVRPVFLDQGLPRFYSLLRPEVLKSILRLPRLPLFRNMHQVNTVGFRNPKTVQLFNRYATYNGSDPYRAPALLNLIPHLEFNMGAFLPEKGMHQITEHLYQLALSLGVNFYFDHGVQKITLENNRVSGIISNKEHYPAEIVVSDIDIRALYKNLLPRIYEPVKLLNQEKSSSAYVFYWGIKHSFPQLGLHNILFSDNYREEFRCLFQEDGPCADPTIYINISSKCCEKDAPPGCENWFVMVNVPHNKNGGAISYGTELRQNVIKKINHVLKIKVTDYIEHEAILDPEKIEHQTSSFGGSLYGNASNSPESAFLRHANFSSKIKGLYLAGGSVHPGGGIPLCLLSAKIVSELISKKEA